MFKIFVMIVSGRNDHETVNQDTIEFNTREEADIATEQLNYAMPGPCDADYVHVVKLYK